MARSLRVGSVPYLVARPLDAGLEGHPKIELERDVPARLVERLREGELDVALSSSIELFRQPGYRYLDGPVVAGRGFVSSVQLFLRRPIEAVRRIALDPASRTTAALVQVLLSEGREPADWPELVEPAPGQDAAAVEADAWLRIGDTALVEHLRAGAQPAWNPAAAWTMRTRLPFVFATWIVRPEVELKKAHLAAFADAARQDPVWKNELARAAADAWQLPIEACRRYLLDECVYALGEELRPTLFAFRDRAARLELCDGALEPDAIPLGGAYA